MASFKKCPAEVHELASEILCEFSNHKPLLDAKVKFDFVFAFASRDEAGQKTGSALTLHGAPALGIAKKTSLKDRALGRGDCEVALDGDWWAEAPDEQKKALLDHELYHFLVVIDEKTVIKKDTCGRPCIEIRQHDFQFGWFKEIAQRHGEHSMERIQAKQILEEAAQMFWPEILK